MEVFSPWRKCQGTTQRDKEIKEEEGKMQMTEGKTKLPVEAPPKALSPRPEQTTQFQAKTVYLVSGEMLTLAWLIQQANPAQQKCHQSPSHTGPLFTITEHS